MARVFNGKLMLTGTCGGSAGKVQISHVINPGNSHSAAAAAQCRRRFSRPPMESDLGAEVG